MEHKDIITQTVKWIQEVVIGLNFCPFAAKEVKNNSIRYSVSLDKEAETCLHLLLEECQVLDEHPEIETTLLIFPESFDDFDAYLDFADYAEQVLAQNDYEGIYQVATFHPEYRFADSEENDAANYTNRSPYPMLHLLREESLDKVIAKHPNIDSIPETNIVNARAKGILYMEALRLSCFDTTS